jgi:hypothetical protein
LSFDDEQYHVSIRQALDRSFFHQSVMIHEKSDRDLKYFQDANLLKKPNVDYKQPFDQAAMENSRANLNGKTVA